ncbi:hypothetical protein BTVI_135014 [Pitangus sulphuratus]|nr:hypothetical protein BTVI_135014 [Pitangus sulphuratus]
MTFNMTKLKVLHLGQGNPWNQYMPEDEQIESRPAEKDLGCWWMRLDMTQQCALTTHKAKRVLGCIKRSRSGEVILSLYSAVGESPEEDTKMIRGMEHLSYEERLRELGLFSLEKRRLENGVIVAFRLNNLFVLFFTRGEGGEALEQVAQEVVAPPSLGVFKGDFWRMMGFVAVLGRQSRIYNLTCLHEHPCLWLTVQQYVCSSTVLTGNMKEDDNLPLLKDLDKLALLQANG